MHPHAPMTTLRSIAARLVGAAAVLAALAADAPQARATAFQVSPTRFEFSLERRFTNFFTVTNNSGEELRLRVSTAFLELGPEGKLQEKGRQPLDLTPWIVLNPRRITLGPSEKRVVRFTVRPPAGLAAGEYRTVVLFEELPPRPGEHPQESTGFRVQILTRLGVTIYGSIGQAAPDPRLEQPAVTVEPAGVRLKAVLRNAGNAHAALQVVATLLAADGSEQGQASQHLTVQREQEAPFELTLPRPAPGSYRLRVVGRAESATVFERELPLTVVAAP
jgi:P pilus assembly chaperone PapD